MQLKPENKKDEIGLTFSGVHAMSCALTFLW
jgi:hypothetical protein